MKRLLFLLAAALAFCIPGDAQVQTSNSINWDLYQITGSLSLGRIQKGFYADPSAWLQIGNDSTTKGLLLPRILHVSSIASPKKGLIAYCHDSTGLVYYNGTAWKKVGAGGGGSVGNQGVSVPFSDSIPFSRDYSIMNHIITGPVNFVPITAGRIAWGGTVMRLVSDGVNIPTFDSIFYHKGDLWDNTMGRVHDVYFVYNGGEYEVSLSQGAIVSLPDVTPPTITARNSNSTTTIRMTGSEHLNGTSAGWTFKKGSTLGSASTMTITGMTGSGTNNLDFTVTPSISPSDSLWTSYNSTTGNIADDSGNHLASFTNQVIINNNVASGLIAAYFLEEATGATRIDQLATYNLTQTGGVTQQTGKVNFGAGFASGQKLGSTTLAPNSPGGSQPWTITFWIKVNSLPASDCGLFGRATEFGSYVLSSGQIRFSITNPSSTSNLFDRAWSTGATVGTWEMRTVVYTGTALNLYVNGALDNGAFVVGGAGSESGGVRYNSADAFYFGDSGFSTNAPDYYIDQLRIYNTALTLVQIQNLYNGGAGM